ncbi:MAG: SDR family oxidoreductase [Deinococcales bacterium]
MNELFQTLAERNRLPDIVLIINVVARLEERQWILVMNFWMGFISLPYVGGEVGSSCLPTCNTKAGAVLAITSLSVKQPVMNLALSNSLRAGVTGYLKTLATEIIADGITVNAVGPAHIDTERLNELFADEAPKLVLAKISRPSVWAHPKRSPLLRSF